MINNKSCLEFYVGFSLFGIQTIIERESASISDDKSREKITQHETDRRPLEKESPPPTGRNRSTPPRLSLQLTGEGKKTYKISDTKSAPALSTWRHSDIKFNCKTNSLLFLVKWMTIAMAKNGRIITVYVTAMC